MYTYIFGVRVEIDKYSIPKLELDFMIEYDDDDVRRLNLASEQIKNELWKSTVEEALINWDHNNIIEQIKSVKFRIHTEKLSTYKFSSVNKWDRQALNDFIELANENEEVRKLLNERRINLL